ncbi:MAG: hypothetical protein K6348_06670 [Deferribacterales bacterium]
MSVEFNVIFKQVMDIADEILQNKDIDRFEEMLNRYNNFIHQIMQISDAGLDNDDIQLFNNLVVKHNKLVDHLKNCQQNIKKEINKKVVDLSLENKFLEKNNINVFDRKI